MTPITKNHRYLIANAPCSWGVEDAGNPDNPPWEQVLNEAAQAGYSGLELGPYGYLPTDVSVLKDELAVRSLKISAGTIFEPLWDQRKVEFIIDKTRSICRLLKASGGKYLVIIDSVNDIRSSFAGMDNDAPRLNDGLWKTMMTTIEHIADVANEEFGIKPVLHPHAGGYIEYADEVIRAMDYLCPERVGLCLDTGHCVYAGMDPVKWLMEYQDRLEYVHFKDVRRERLDHCVNTRTGFWDACKYGVMCPIGEGCVDYSAVQAALEAIDYQGWIVVEQERDPREAQGSFDDVSKSYQFLKASGF